MKKAYFLACFVALLSLAKADDRVAQLQTNHATSNIATTGWTQIAAAGTLIKPVTYIDVYNSSTSGTLILGVGAAGGEVESLVIPASTARVFPLSIGKNARISLKAKNATVSAGESIINFFGRAD